MEKAKLDDLSQVFVKLTDEKQEGILEMSKSLLKAQRHSRSLVEDKSIPQHTLDGFKTPPK